MCRSNTKPSLRALFLLLLLPLVGTAQQDAQYSQYAFNTLLINPAYAGSRESMSLTALYRHQWAGFEGAPRTASFSAHAPSANLRHGFGVSFLHDEVGPTASDGLNLSYAYRIPVSTHGWLALGLQGEVTNYRVGYGKVRLDQPNDLTLGNATVNRLLPNAGTGIWYNDRKLFIGFSAPRLIPNKLSPLADAGNSRRILHGFGMIGYVIDLGKSLKFRPSIMAKYVPSTPVSLDFNAALLLKDKVWVGASYRTDRSWIFMTQLQFSPALRLGYSYDLAAGNLRSVQSGSHEIMLGADLNFTKNKLVSPRYF